MTTPIISYNCHSFLDELLAVCENIVAGTSFALTSSTCYFTDHSSMTCEVPKQLGHPNDGIWLMEDANSMPSPQVSFSFLAKRSLLPGHPIRLVDTIVTLNQTSESEVCRNVC